VNFMNVGPLELTVILIIAILTIGPKRMVEVIRAISRVTAQLRRFSREFTSTLQAEVMATGEAAGGPPENIVKSLTEPITSVQAELAAAGRETRQALEGVVSDNAKAIESIRTEIKAAARETTQALEQEEEIAQVDIEDDPTQEH
jgi:Sec-independent protein translocase protein TatA